MTNPETKPDTLAVWNWFVAFGVMCDRLTAPQLHRLCDLIIEHVCEDAPFDAVMRERVEDIVSA